MTQIDGTTLLTMADFGTKGFMTLEPNNSTQEEQISFSGITQNANGTATLTGVKTVLFVSPYTETSGLAKAHTGGSKAIVSNSSGFYNELTSKDDDETINGLYTFAQFPQKSGTTTPTIAAELASKAYVDSVAGGIAITNQILVSGTAGENLTTAYVVGKKLTDGKWYIVKANDTSTFNEFEIGTAQATATTGNTLNILVRGLDSRQTGLVAGTEYFATDSGGLVSSSFSATNLIFVGYGQSATSLLVHPRNIDIPLHSEKGALVGSSGTASTTNRYITQADVSSGSVAGKILRTVTTLGTVALPALSGISLKSTNIAGLFITGQTQGDIIVKNSTNGWTRVASSTGKVPIGTIVSPGIASQFVPKYSQVVATRAGDAASGSQTIAHLLGLTPRKVCIRAVKNISGTTTYLNSTSVGTFSGTTTRTVYTAGGPGDATAGTGNDSTNIVAIYDDLTGGAVKSQLATVAVDGTNVTLTWTKASTPNSNTISLLVETEA